MSCIFLTARAELKPLMFEGYMANGIAAGGQLTTTTVCLNIETWENADKLKRKKYLMRLGIDFNGGFLFVKVHFYGVWLKLSPWTILSIPVAILYCSYWAVDFNKKKHFAKVHLPKNSPRASGQMTK